MKFTSLHWALSMLVLAVAVTGGIVLAEFLITKKEEAAAKIPA